jgi:hypothetical protein
LIPDKQCPKNIIGGLVQLKEYESVQVVGKAIGNRSGLGTKAKTPKLKPVLMENEYHGIIIQQSLKDQSILNGMRILGERVGNWTLLRVGIEGERIGEVVKLVKKNLLTENSVPYYAHFYRGQRLIVVFPDKVFYVKPNKETWSPVLAYGISKGIPADQMDIKPSRFDEETY